MVATVVVSPFLWGFGQIVDQNSRLLSIRILIQSGEGSECEEQALVPVGSEGPLALQNGQQPLPLEDGSRGSLNQVSLTDSGSSHSMVGPRFYRQPQHPSCGR